MNLTLRQLEVFVATARAGTVTRAAADLAMTQSAASTSLAELERMIGVPLFDRVGRRLVLNSTGEAVLPYAERVLSEAESVVLVAKGVDEGLVGRVRVGASTTIGNHVLPHLLTDIVLANPELKLVIRVGSTDEVADWVASRAIDFGLVEGPFVRRGVISSHWLEDEIVIAAARSVVDTIERSGFSAARWIVREPGSGTRLVVENALIEAGIAVRDALEVGSTEAVKRFAMNGVGVAAISRRAITAELAGGTLLEVEFPRRITRSFTIATTSPAALSHVAQGVLDGLR